MSGASLQWALLVAALTPAAAMAEPPPLAIYGQLPGFETASISPSGNHIAIMGTIDGTREVIVLDARRKVLLQVPLAGKFKFRGVSWAGDQALLLDYTLTSTLGPGFTTDKAELGSVIVVPLDKSRPWEVFAKVSVITGGVWGTYGVVERNGRWFGYFGGVTLERSNAMEQGYLPGGTLHPDLYEVDLQNQKLRKVAPKTDGDGSWRDWLIDDKGTVAVVLDVTSKDGRWRLTNGQGRGLATGTDPRGQVSLIALTPDGNGVIYALRDADGARVLFSVPLAGGEPRPFLADVSPQRFIQDNGHRLIGYIEDNATNDGHFFDPHKDKVFKASQRAFPGLRMVLNDADNAFDRLLVTTEGPGDPETWWLIDIATGSADQLGRSYALRSTDVGPMRMVPYSAADGLKMEGVLTLPPDRPGKALPAVILPHGGPWAYDSVGFDWIAQAFASRGYAVFQPNFRGSTGYGAAFRAAGNGEWGRKMQTDISDGLAELVHQGVVDPKRVCIVGASYGGYAALAGVTLQHGLYRCAVAIAGVSDVYRMVSDEAEESGSDPMLIRNLKIEIGQGRDLKAVSPARFADKVDVPVLLIHGKDDTVVNYSQSTAMADALRRAGKKVDFVTLNAEDHWLSKSETRLQMLQASVDFVVRNNPPDAAVVKPQ